MTTAAASASRRAAVVVGVVLVMSSFSWRAEASSWLVVANAGATGRAQSASLAPPANVTATCTAPASAQTITVSWAAVPHATFLIYQSTTGSTGTFSFVTTTTANSWTSGPLSSGITYWYKIATAFSSGWIGTTSAATAGHTIRGFSPYCS